MQASGDEVVTTHFELAANILAKANITKVSLTRLIVLDGGLRLATSALAKANIAEVSPKILLGFKCGLRHYLCDVNVLANADDKEMSLDSSKARTPPVGAENIFINCVVASCE